MVPLKMVNGTAYNRNQSQSKDSRPRVLAFSAKRSIREGLAFHSTSTTTIPKRLKLPIQAVK